MQKVLFLFGELNDDDIDWLITTGNIAKIPTDTVLIRENQPLENLYILLDGSVSVSIDLMDTTKEIAVLQSGEIFGELSFIDRQLPSASVKTCGDCLLLAIPQEKILNRLNQDIGFSARFNRAIATFLASRLRNTVRHLGEDQDFVFNQSFTQEEVPGIVQENFSVATTRFDWLLRRVQSQTAAESPV
ncbi:cyclic nucleotide-binding domain-containing protein [Synechococcus moorigangaii CMS01]|nr:cyclic nucleotide-binding domain-containing protein [Synechococcus moorigangaii CMS01]